MRTAKIIAFTVPFFVLMVSAANSAPKVLLLSWDGADYRSVSQLLEDGKLTNLASLYYVPLVASPMTLTKPGHAEALTGLSFKQTGILDNYDFNTRIQPENTLFGMFGELYPDSYVAAIFSKKHTGDMKEYDSTAGITRREPWYYMKKWDGFDSYYNARSSRRNSPIPPQYPNNMTTEETNSIVHGMMSEANGKDGYLVYVHWADPDHTGHMYGMGSPEWNRSIETLDDMLGYAIDGLQPDHIFVYSDHGFNDWGSMGKDAHRNAPQAFLAANVPLIPYGLRVDIVPTILDALGIDYGHYDKLRGRSLYRSDQCSLCSECHTYSW